MMTPNHPVPLAAPDRGPVRLRLSARPGADRLDGGWWPRSRDLSVELADLVDHFPPGAGRVVRALFSRPDWDDAPHRIPIARGHLKVGSFPRDDTHLVLLSTSDRKVLHLLVVPPSFTAGQGHEALLASATPGNSHSAVELLAEVTEHPEGEAEDLWTDEGGSWWHDDEGVPSYRTGGRSWPT